jgi:transcriptional regulator with XRE-family HTH domain
MKGNILMFLGELIKAYREEHNNMSMAEFAAKCGLSKGYISMLEKNKDPRSNDPIIPSIITIKKVAEAIGLNFNELYNMLDDDSQITLDDSIGEIISDDEMELLLNYRKLSPDEKNNVRIYIKTKVEIETLDRKEK